MKIEGRPYELRIIGEDSEAITETKEGYAPLMHGEHYKIRINNLSSYEDARAEVRIDGVSVGYFAIDKNKAIVLERPSDTAKSFTFFKLESKEAKASLLDKVSEENLGLIEIKLVPGQIIRPMTYYASSAFDDVPMRGGSMKRDSFSFGQASRGLSAGGTGLSGQSSQQFTQVQFYGDEARAVTLRLRLVHDQKRRPAPDVQPLSAHLSNVTPVPPPLGGKGRRGKSPSCDKR